MLESKLAHIKLMIFDVDGVLTEPQVIHCGDALEMKIFNAHDGFGITMARQAGFKIAILTGRISPPAEKRAKELKVDFYEAGHFHKKQALLDIQKKAGVTQEETLYMGDDILDLVCAPLVGIFVAPQDANVRVREAATWVTEINGGKGCVREVIDEVLNAHSKLTETEDYFISGGEKNI